MGKKYKFDVFLSFSSDDIVLANTIREELEKNKLKVFFFKESLKGDIGRYFDKAIEEALVESKDFVLICTPSAMKSKWVEREYRTFFNEFYTDHDEIRRLIILEGEGYDISLVPLFMKRLQIAKSVEEIVEILIEENTQEPESPQPPHVIEERFPPDQVQSKTDSKKRKRKKRKKMFSRIVLLIILTVLVISYLIVILLSDKNSKEPGEVILKEPGKLYVSNLTFMDIRNLSTMARTELGDLIDAAVINGMELVKKTNENIMINIPGRHIVNTETNASTLANITFNPRLSHFNKIDKITNDMMIPNNVDVIVTGQYIVGAKGLITIRPLLIIKKEYNIWYNPLQFKKSELLCEDPQSKKNILCPAAFDRIAGAVKELFDKF